MSPPHTPRGCSLFSAAARRLLVFQLLALFSACGGGGGGTELVESSDELLEKPGGGFFFRDAHRSGRASRLGLVDIYWGRLVDVYDVDADGQRAAEPVHRDLLIREDLLPDGERYRFESNPVTLRTRLVILRTRGLPEGGGESFEELLRFALRDLPPVLPKHDDGSSPAPFSFVARNATLSLRFDDLLDDGPEAQLQLRETVRLLTGYPPSTPFEARLLFDPNHGGVANGRFHSTRILVDLTVSEAEALQSSSPVEVNVVGAPASDPALEAPNFSIHLPTRVDPGSGQFSVLTNRAGAALERSGPVAGVATMDLVRALRAGNEGDLNRGFLLDQTPPRVVGRWPITILEARERPPSSSGDLELVLRYEDACRSAPLAGEVISSGGTFLEVVSAPTDAPDANGVVSGVVVASAGVGDAGSNLSGQSVLGAGTHFPAHGGDEAERSVDPACWINMFPNPRTPPASDLAARTRFAIRFSEPMARESLRAFDTLRLLRGTSAGDLEPTDFVIGRLQPSRDQREFTFEPILPLARNLSSRYRFELVGGADGAQDLAGVPLDEGFPAIEVTLDPDEVAVENAGLVLRFETADELVKGVANVRGQVSFQDGRLIPRRPIFSGVTTERQIPVISLMQPFPPGVQTPLSPLGSKMQAVWRYVDMGWRVTDESKYDLDVVGLSWSPAAGQVTADFYPQFEMRLAHSRYLPDEVLRAGSNAPQYFRTGLPGAPSPFSENILSDPRSPQKIVHPRELGYRVDPSDLSISTAGTPLMPFPWNRGATPLTTYTWRDTAVHALGAPGGVGIPLGIEAGEPLFLERDFGTVATPDNVPSFGLPLLWEIRCFPTSSGVGLNAFNVNIAIVLFATPAFRAFSTGGFDQTGAPVVKDPDLESFPSGGFSASGNPTAFTADNTFYVGRLEYAIRLTRVFTSWIDSTLGSPRYLPFVLEPSPGEQPGQSAVRIEVRGADGFSVLAGSAPFDASRLDPYGELEDGFVHFHGGVDEWTETVEDLDGARYFQMRLTFENDIEAGLSPTLSSLGIAVEPNR